MTLKPLYWTFALLMLAGVVGLTIAGGANARRPAGKRPNIIFVLTDDLAWNLVKYMPHVKQLRARGTTFTNYIVTDSLCCPSRASTFTGQYPHDTSIFTNGGDDGGFALREQARTMAALLRNRGFSTGAAVSSFLLRRSTGLAQGLPLPQAVKRARDYVLEAIRTAPGFVRGHGPINHAHTVTAFQGAESEA